MRPDTEKLLLTFSKASFIQAGSLENGRQPRRESATLENCRSMSSAAALGKLWQTGAPFLLLGKGRKKVPGREGTHATLVWM